MMTVAPFALIRFMTPWIEDCLKLSELDFMVSAEDYILWYIVKVCRKLFGIFWQAVSAVSEAWVIVMSSDTWIQADAFNDLLCVQAFCLCVGIKLIEIRYTKCKVSIRKQLNSLSFGKSHE